MAETERIGDFVVAAALERGAEHDLALQVGKRGEPGQGLPRGESLLELVVGTRAPHRLAELDRVGARLAPTAHRHVVDDPVQPRADVARLGARADGHPGLEQRLLKNVLGACLGGREPATVGQELPAVALDQRLEGSFMAGARQLEQTRVRLSL